MNLEGHLNLTSLSQQELIKLILEKEERILELENELVYFRAYYEKLDLTRINKCCDNFENENFR